METLTVDRMNSDNSPPNTGNTVGYAGATDQAIRVNNYAVAMVSIVHCVSTLGVVIVSIYLDDVTWFHISGQPVMSDMKSDQDACMGGIPHGSPSA